MAYFPGESGGSYTVSELTALIRTVLEQDFSDIWVRGEISNFVVPRSGHFYLTLKDADAQLRAVCFRGMQRRISFRPQNGMEVAARGRITVYEPRGEYQLIVSEMMDLGQGRLQLAFEQLKEKLNKEGLFDPALKKDLPMLPARVGVVTSATGAAIRDIVRVLRRRNSAVHVELYPVKVQGEGAAQEIAEGIAYFHRQADLDVIIVGRGGGSLEDLWAFNEEVVARAIFACTVPVISAVGHEIDFTITDFVADVRAATPSAAAEIVSAAAEELASRVNNLLGSLRASWDRYISQRKHRFQLLFMSRGFSGMPHRLAVIVQKVDERQMRLQYTIRELMTTGEKSLADLRHRLTLANPLKTLGECRHELDTSRQWLSTAMANYLTEKNTVLKTQSKTLRDLNPNRVLERGYAVCLDEKGTLVRFAEDVAPGSGVDVLLQKGALECKVEKRRQQWASPDNSNKNTSRRLIPPDHD